jgi:hypothetical protein
VVAESLVVSRYNMPYKSEFGVQALVVCIMSRKLRTAVMFTSMNSKIIVHAFVRWPLINCSSNMNESTFWIYPAIPYRFSESWGLIKVNRHLSFPDLVGPGNIEREEGSRSTYFRFASSWIPNLTARGSSST